MSNNALTRGIDHIGLTVRDLAQTRDFFEKCLGWKVVGERPEYPAAFVSDGHITLTLWQVKNTDAIVEFDRKANIGLHHLALRVDSEESLNTLFERIAAWPGARVEFSPEQLGKGPKRHTMIYEPGGIRLEFDYDTSTKPS